MIPRKQASLALLIHLDRGILLSFPGPALVTVHILKAHTLYRRCILHPLARLTVHTTHDE